jgi:hypothetical protein
VWTSSTRLPLLAQTGSQLRAAAVPRPGPRFGRTAFPRSSRWPSPNDDDMSTTQLASRHRRFGRAARHSSVLRARATLPRLCQPVSRGAPSASAALVKRVVLVVRTGPSVAWSIGRIVLHVRKPRRGDLRRLDKTEVAGSQAESSCFCVVDALLPAAGATIRIQSSDEGRHSPSARGSGGGRRGSCSYSSLQSHAWHSRPRITAPWGRGLLLLTHTSSGAIPEGAHQPRQSPGSTRRSDVGPQPLSSPAPGSNSRRLRGCGAGH